MLKIRAELTRKPDSFKTPYCMIEKTIEVSGGEFDSLIDTPYIDRDFITDNKAHMWKGGDGAHCLLVLGENRSDGVLIESEGYNWVRYGALIPHARDIIAAQNMSPALKELNQKLTAMADYIVESAMHLPKGDNRAVVSMDALEEISGIDVARNSTITSTLTKMLNNRPEISDWELDKNEFIITPAPTMTEPEQDITPQEQTMNM